MKQKSKVAQSHDKATYQLFNLLSTNQFYQSDMI